MVNPFFTCQKKYICCEEKSPSLDATDTKEELIINIEMLFVYSFIVFFRDLFENHQFKLSLINKVSILKYFNAHIYMCMQYSTGQIRLEINISNKTKHINKCIDFYFAPT